jgi:hypothetical protein
MQRIKAILSGETEKGLPLCGKRKKRAFIIAELA